MFSKFMLEGFAEGAWVEGSKVFKTKILIYRASTEAWDTGLEGTTKLWSCVLQSQYSRFLVLKDPQNNFSSQHKYKNFPSPLQKK